MGYKEDLWLAINDELPESIANLSDVTLNVSSITGPTDPDGAIVETGKLAAKLNAILDSLDGLSLVELALHIGQKNATSKMMLLASIEADTADSSEEEAANAAGFNVLAPKEGKEYEAWTFPFQVERLDPAITAITCLVDTTLEVDLVRDGNLFTGSPQELMHPGEHSATFTGSNEKSLVVTFSIAELEFTTYPGDGGSVSGPVVQISLTPDNPDADLSSASCSIAGKTFTLLKDAAANSWRATIDFASFTAEEIPNLAAVSASFVVDAASATAEKVVSFAVNMVGGD